MRTLWPALVSALIAGTLAGCVMAGAPAGLPPTGCSAALLERAQWVSENLMRVKLDGTKPEIFSQLGQPQTMESFLLEGGQAVEVLFYPTPASACGQGGTLPLVLQNNRLIGYGPTYYQQVVVPLMQTKARAIGGVPVSTAPAVPEAKAAPSSGAGLGRGEPLR